MPEVVLEGIEKVYGKKVIASSIDYLKIEDGEFFVLLGPSGCGKTTTLRIIAGLIKPTKGRVLVGGKDITDLPPEKRNITMVFQNFALFPHLNVYENIAYGLKMRKLSKDVIDQRVRDAARLMRIEDLLDRRIDQLSGGQQQRVGVARAIAPHPDIILFDEPLSNLDAKLREEVRFELKEVHKKIGTTSVYVTHDQAEAMVMADRIAVMRSGKIIQIGGPKEIYFRPKNLFVAGFIGIMSELPVEVLEKNGEDLRVRLATGDVINSKGEVQAGEKGYMIVRPESVEILPKDSEERENVVEGKLVNSIFLGSEVEYRVLIGDIEVRTKIKPHEDVYKPGENIKLRILSSWVVGD
jgi:ABC-type sugar transport system ATPase subunit